MFLSLRRCAEHMNQLPRLKVTGQGIYPWISCLLYISWTIWTIFIKLHPNVPLGEVVCRTNNAATQTQGLGHTSRSKNLPLNFVSFKSSQPCVKFSLNITQMFLSVLCKVKVTLQGHRILRRGIWLSFILLSCSYWALCLKCSESASMRRVNRNILDVGTQCLVKLALIFLYNFHHDHSLLKLQTKKLSPKINVKNI